MVINCEQISKDFLYDVPDFANTFSKRRSDSVCYKADISMDRCVTSDNSPYFPPNFGSQTSYGYRDLLKIVLNSSEVFYKDAVANFNLTSVAKNSSNEFWFLYETLFVELQVVYLRWYSVTSDSLIARLKENILIGQICYGTSLILVILVYFLLFRQLHQYFVDQNRCHRKSLYLIPQDVLRDHKPLKLFIQNIHTTLYRQAEPQEEDEERDTDDNA
jgi:hypothetical protein